MLYIQQVALDNVGKGSTAAKRIAAEAKTGSKGVIARRREGAAAFSLKGADPRY